MPVSDDGAHLKPQTDAEETVVWLTAADGSKRFRPAGKVALAMTAFAGKPAADKTVAFATFDDRALFEPQDFDEGKPVKPFTFTATRMVD